MNNATILVTGATGKTGSATAESLLLNGSLVRALARKQDERTDRLQALGAEVVFGDFHDLDTIRAALAGVKGAYFCYPPQGTHLVEATVNFAIAARDAGVETVVNMSQITARENAPSPLSRQHWMSERVLDWAGVGAVHIAATFFVENLFMFGAKSISEQGMLYLPYGDDRHAPVSAGDLAAVIATILINPEPHLGKRYVITGPALLSISEMATALSEVLGQSIEYVDLPREAWAEALEGVPGMSPSLITHLGHVADDHKNGVFREQNNLVQTITGSPAESFSESILRLSEAFGLHSRAT